MNISKMTTLAGILAMVLFFPFSSAQAIEYGGFGGKPAYPRADNPRTDSVFIHTLQPGATQQEGVLVVNNSAEQKTLMVYATDSERSSGGAFACKQLVEGKTDVGAWISLAKSEVTLDPGTNEMVPFTITAPASASVGEHNGCILIQEKKEPVVGQIGAVVSVRTGIRVALTIPGDIIRKLEIVGFTVTPAPVGFLLHPLVKNTGNVSIDADVAVTTRYFFGKTYFAHGGQYPILRGDTSEWNFELAKPFWGLWYRSSFTVTYDENPGAVVGVPSGQPLTTLAGPDVWFFSMPAPLALAIYALVLLIIFGFFWWISRRRSRARARASMPTTPSIP